MNTSLPAATSEPRVTAMLRQTSRQATCLRIRGLRLRLTEPSAFTSDGFCKGRRTAPLMASASADAAFLAVAGIGRHRQRLWLSRFHPVPLDQRNLKHHILET